MTDAVTAPPTDQQRQPLLASSRKGIDAALAPSSAAAATITTSLPSVPATVAFPPPSPELADAVPSPHVPRANVAPTAEKPDGGVIPAGQEGMSVLQRHCAFFDHRGDGIIWPSDTYRGFHEIGLIWPLAVVACFVIHGTFAFWSADSIWSALRDLPRGAPLQIKNMDRCLHGSHSGSYDSAGRFDVAAFERVFSSFGEVRNGIPGISWRGILTMLRRQRSIMDPMGMTAAFLEWGTLYLLAADHERGFLEKEDARGCFDGTLWPRLAERVAERRARGRGGGWAAWGSSDGGAGRPHAQ
jgi:hypothetical protein